MVPLSAADLGSMTRQQAESEIHARIQTVFLGDGVILARVLGGQKLLLRASDRGFSRHVMMDGFWESWLTVFCAKLLKPGMVAFDVGANLGYYTLLFANRVGSTGAVIAIEPNPQTFDLLSQSVELNGYDRFVSLVQAAATARTGDSVELFVPFGEPKNATVAFAGHDRPAELTTVVTTVCIDDLARGRERVDFIKIDVEGAEPAVVAGMMETIDRFKPTIVLEFNASRYAEPAEVLNRLASVYGHVGEVQFDGHYHPVRPEEILSERTQEDRLLCFLAPGVQI